MRLVVLDGRQEFRRRTVAEITVKKTVVAVDVVWCELLMKFGPTDAV